MSTAPPGASQPGASLRIRRWTVSPSGPPSRARRGSWSRASCGSRAELDRWARRGRWPGSGRSGRAAPPGPARTGRRRARSHPPAPGSRPRTPRLPGPGRRRSGVNGPARWCNASPSAPDPAHRSRTTSAVRDATRPPPPNCSACRARHADEKRSDQVLSGRAAERSARAATGRPASSRAATSTRCSERWRGTKTSGATAIRRPAELRPADDVLQRLTGDPARDQRPALRGSGRWRAARPPRPRPRRSPPRAAPPPRA